MTETLQKMDLRLKMFSALVLCALSGHILLSEKNYCLNDNYPHLLGNNCWSSRDYKTATSIGSHVQENVYKKLLVLCV